MAAVVLAPHPEPRRRALRLVVSTPQEARLPRSRRSAVGSCRRPSRAVYRRRRAMVALLAVTLLVLGWLAVGTLVAPAEDVAVLTAGSAPVAPVADVVVPPLSAAPSGAASSTYVVRPGDTVWSIAQRLRPEGDVRDLVDQLSERAGGSGLRAGQRIALDGLAV